MTDDVILRLELQCDERAPRLVRAALAGLEGIGRCAQALLLISSELVTNAVVHSGCERRDPLYVCLYRRERGYLLSVTDRGVSGTSAAPATGRAPGEGGLGLRIVELLAERWGHSRGRGYQVWAEVAA